MVGTFPCARVRALAKFQNGHCAAQEDVFEPFGLCSRLCRGGSAAGRGGCPGALSTWCSMKRIFLLAVLACYLSFTYFLYHRWLATEYSARGPIPFSALIGGTNVTLASASLNAANLPPIFIERVSWTTILTPLWVADVLTMIAHATLLLVQHAWRPSATSLNAKLEHASGGGRAILYALFKVLLLSRLDPDPSKEVLSWRVVFSPIYSAAVLQMVLHSCKTLEGGETLFRGRDASRPRRRPGFALTLDDTLAFNISLHLSGGLNSTHPLPPTPAHAFPRVAAPDSLLLASSLTATPRASARPCPRPCRSLLPSQRDVVGGLLAAMARGGDLRCRPLPLAVLRRAHALSAISHSPIPDGAPATDAAHGVRCHRLAANPDTPTPCSRSSRLPILLVVLTSLPLPALCRALARVAHPHLGRASSLRAGPTRLRCRRFSRASRGSTCPTLA